MAVRGVGGTTDSDERGADARTQALLPMQALALGLALALAVTPDLGCRERAHREMPPPELFAAEADTTRATRPGSAVAHAPAVEAGDASTNAATAAEGDALGTAAVPSRPAAPEVPVSDDPSCPGPGEDVARCPRLMPAPLASVTVGQILIGWKGSLPDPRLERDPTMAETLARDLLHRARLPGADLFALAAVHSDDSSDGLYHIDEQSAGRYVGSVVERARRLGVGQVDLVRSRFGWHVLQRLADGTQAPPRRPVDLCAGPCPLLTERSSACPGSGAASAAEVEVDTLWVGWRGSPGPGRRERSRDQARALAVELCHAARGEGASFEALRARHRDDPGDGRRVVRPDSELAAPYLRMALSLTPDAVAVVETVHGFHVLHRRR